MFYNTFSVSKNVIYIIRSGFGESRSYGSRFRSICLGHNTYTVSRIVKRGILPLSKDLYWKMKKIHYKIYYFNVTSQILAEKVINNLKIKASCDTRIIDISNIIFFSWRWLWKTICLWSICDYIWNKKNMIGLYNTAHVKYMYIHLLETTNNTMKAMKYKLLL